MNANYKNWMPAGLIWGTLGITAAMALLTAYLGLPSLFGKISAGLTMLLLLVTLWMVLMYRAFSYNGTRQMSRQIVEGVSEYVRLPEGGLGLDVGCGSGALTIACAKRNPKARMLGIDRWGAEYASFSRQLCESNAAAEGVTNVSFQRGDATKLEFPDESFDAVTSNYVYHNIPVKDRQAILLETLRTLKKGGTFAIHDIMSESNYGNIYEFAEKLRGMGYEEVALIDTTDGKFMSPWESTWMALSGSKILLGKK